MPNPELVARAWYAEVSPESSWDDLDGDDRGLYRFLAGRALAGWSGEELYLEWCDRTGREVANWSGLSDKRRMWFVRIHLVAVMHTLGVGHLPGGSSVAVP